MKKKALPHLLSLLLIVALPSLALEISDTRTQSTAPESLAIAQLWHLSTSEWRAYQQALRGPAGQWYDDLNPAEVLGLMAKTDTERAHYAEIVVKARYQRITRELAFNSAVSQAWQRLYPQLKPIADFDTRPFAPVKIKASATTKK